MALGPAYPCSQLDPLPYSIIAKTRAWKFLYFLIWSMTYISVLFLSFSLRSFSFLLFLYPSLLHFLVYLGLRAVSFFHSFIHFFFPFLLLIKILATAKYSYEDEHLPFLQNFAVRDSCTYFGQFRMFQKK